MRLLLGRMLAVAQVVLPLSVPSSPHACPLEDGELLTQAGCDPVPARGEDGDVLLCAITKGPSQSELRSKYALVTGHISITTQPKEQCCDMCFTEFTAGLSCSLLLVAAESFYRTRHWIKVLLTSKPVVRGGYAPSSAWHSKPYSINC